MKKAYIIPGYAATPHDHWFQSTAKALQEKGIPVHVVEFPSPEAPSLQMWLAHLRQDLKELDSDSILIAHSLGCITTLRFIASIQPKPHIRSAVLVSPFAEKLPNLPQLDEFNNDPLDIPEILASAEFCKIIASDNDPIVPPDVTHRFGAAAGLPVDEIKSGGHFLAEDGYKSFPALVSTILALK